MQKEIKIMWIIYDSSGFDFYRVTCYVNFIDMLEKPKNYKSDKLR